MQLSMKVYESNMALQAVVPPGRFRGLFATSLALGWAPGDDELSP